MATLEDLEARVAALEATAVMPAYAPSGGQVIAPDGKVTYDFDGHVHARGVDLDAAARFDVTETDAQVLWRRTSGTHIGEPAAGLQGYVDAAGVGHLGALTTDEFGAPQTRELLDGHGNSDFLQTDGINARQTLRGPFVSGLFSLASGGEVQVAIPHRLGHTNYNALAVWLQDLAGGAVHWFTWAVRTGDAQNIYAAARNTSGALVGNARFVAYVLDYRT